MLTNLTHSEDAFEEPGRSIGLKLIAGICAVVVTAAVFSGYAYLRNLSEDEQRLLESGKVTEVTERESVVER